jgi:DinB superfamily
MKQRIIRQYDFNLVFAKQLVDDLTDEQMTTKPSIGFENHPAFTLGHLVTGSAMTIEDLGGKIEIPDGWGELFLRKGPGDPSLPSDNIKLYPTKNDLLKELEKQHNKLKECLLTIEDFKLDEKVQWRFASYMPTLIDVVIFMCINHEAMHLGQLSAWRRAMGLSTALGKIN